MRAYELLTEGSGLRAARAGEIYVDESGTEYKFQSWNWQHPTDSDTYSDLDSLKQGISDVTNGNQDKIKWVNTETSRTKSFAYAIFKSDAGDEQWIGKFYERKNPNNTILDKEVKSILGLSAKGKTSVVKSEAALQPIQLGIADGRSRSLKSIIETVSRHTQGNMLADSLNRASSGSEIIFEGGANIASALQDDFCEVVSPIAMISAHPQVTGQIEKAVSDVFKGDNLEGATISFPAGQNNPLVDSYIVKNGITLGVSHKGKQGAKATITNIWKAKEEAARTTTGQTYIKKFPEAVTILDICRNEVGITQPITLAVRYKLISDQEESALRELIQNPRNPKYQLTGNPGNPNAVVRQATPDDAKKVPPALRRLFNMGGYKSGSYVSFLCLARVAYIVANHINTDPKIDFGEAIRSFLNSSAMVQASSIVTVKDRDAVLKGINVVYPPNFTDKAKIESNGYSGTQVKGKFSFSLPTT